MNLRKKVTSTLAAAALVALPSLTIAGETLDRVKNSGVLTIATEAAWPPYSFLDENNEMSGFDVEVAGEIAKRLGVDLKVVTPNWNVITAGNWVGRWDLSVGSMTPTKARAEKLDFPAIYYYTPASLAVHKDFEGNNVDDLNGKDVGAPSGTTYFLYLNKELVIDAQGTPPFEFAVTPGQIKAQDSTNALMDDLRLGDGVRLDGIMLSLPALNAAIETGYPFKILGNPAFYEPLAVATDKGDPEFNAAVSQAVADMQSDGTMRELSVKWFGHDYTTAVK